MTTENLSIPVSISDLRARFAGRVIAPGYDAARTVYYGGFDRRPAAIVRAADAADVARVVTLARTAGVELAVRSGGHSAAGYSVSDGGIVLDLSEMKTLEIDPEGRTAWVQPGLTAGEYTVADDGQRGGVVRRRRGAGCARRLGGRLCGGAAPGRRGSLQRLSG